MNNYFYGLVFNKHIDLQNSIWSLSGKFSEIYVNFCLSAYNSIDANWCAFYLQQYKYVAKKHCSSSILPEIFEDPS